MIGLDVTHRAVTGPDVQRRLREAGSIGVFVAELVDFFTVYHRQTYGWDGAPIHDAVAVAHVIRPGLVETKRPQRGGRARLGALPWANRGRPLASHRASGERTHVGVDLDSDGVLRPARRADRTPRLGSTRGRRVVFVEVPSGSRNKYERDAETGTSCSTGGSSRR